MRVFVLTGAGVSAESGLGTFRDTGGAWARFDPMKLATPQGFALDPHSVHEFYNMRRRDAIAAAPNAAHYALARLQTGLRERGGDLFLCTQNIDDLHERSGSFGVHHMHGELLKARCQICETVVPCAEDLSTALACAACGRAGGMRPDIVWFGEIPMGMLEIETALAASDIFVAIGTSGAVYPAAGFVEMARDCGLRTLELNLDASDNAYLFTESRLGPATETVPQLVTDLIGDY